MAESIQQGPVNRKGANCPSKTNAAAPFVQGDCSAGLNRLASMASGGEPFTMPGCSSKSFNERLKNEGRRACGSMLVRGSMEARSTDSSSTNSRSPFMTCDLRARRPVKPPWACQVPLIGGLSLVHHAAVERLAHY